MREDNKSALFDNCSFRCIGVYHRNRSVFLAEGSDPCVRTVELSARAPLAHFALANDNEHVPFNHFAFETAACLFIVRMQNKGTTVEKHQQKPDKNGYPEKYPEGG